MLGCRVEEVRFNATATSNAAAVAYRLEVVVIPDADVDRANGFYVDRGWRVGSGFPGDNGYRLVRLTAPGSEASIIFGGGVTAGPPGSSDGLLLALDNLDEGARRPRGARGGGDDVFHDEGGGSLAASASGMRVAPRPGPGDPLVRLVRVLPRHRGQPLAGCRRSPSGFPAASEVPGHGTTGRDSAQVTAPTASVRPDLREASPRREAGTVAKAGSRICDNR